MFPALPRRAFSSDLQLPLFRGVVVPSLPPTPATVSTVPYQACLTKLRISLDSFIFSSAAFYFHRSGCPRNLPSCPRHEQPQSQPHPQSRLCHSHGHCRYQRQSGHAFNCTAETAYFRLCHSDRSFPFPFPFPDGISSNSPLSPLSPPSPPSPPLDLSTSPLSLVHPSCAASQVPIACPCLPLWWLST